ncbi:uncharacterized protein LOC125177722 [Hyalella azteca]|uniref:Uncharacterized protein LOC125177722 n=1 Tax=Hyalella azteca TaxID=294128 RepID=A0A979FH97_HYAAZ|nr:uncharacterized protein LOC125177722 [Hyalella azteca]
MAMSSLALLSSNASDLGWTSLYATPEINNNRFHNDDLSLFLLQRLEENFVPPAERTHSMLLVSRNGTNSETEETDVLKLISDNSNTAKEVVQNVYDFIRHHPSNSDPETNNDVAVNSEDDQLTDIDNFQVLYNSYGQVNPNYKKQQQSNYTNPTFSSTVNVDLHQTSTLLTEAGEPSVIDDILNLETESNIEHNFEVSSDLFLEKNLSSNLTELANSSHVTTVSSSNVLESVYFVTEPPIEYVSFVSVMNNILSYFGYTATSFVFWIDCFTGGLFTILVSGLLMLYNTVVAMYSMYFDVPLTRGFDIDAFWDLSRQNSRDCSLSNAHLYSKNFLFGEYRNLLRNAARWE